MPVNKKQLRRLLYLVAELKQNRYPNTVNFAAKLERLDIDDNRPLSCTPKTVQRDLRVLRDEFGAPIDFDPERNGYYLTHHGWDFQCPIFEEQEMVAAVLGARLAEEIFPDPVRNDIGRATAAMLSQNNPDFLDTATVDALIVASGLRVTIDADVFRTVFEAWQSRRSLNICYRSADGSTTERIIDPHVLAYQDAAWFVKGWCHLRDGIRVFAVHRMVRVALEETFFDADREIIDQVRDGLLFDYHKVRNVRIKCASCLAPFIIERKLHSAQRVQRHRDGSFTVTIPLATEYDVLSWVLSQTGLAELLGPHSLRAKLAKTAAAMSRSHRGRG